MQPHVVQSHTRSSESLPEQAGYEWLWAMGYGYYIIWHVMALCMGIIVKWWFQGLYVHMLFVIVFMLLFNVSSLPLMFYVLYVLGIFCP
jgi:Flp pilus assembly protein TadB